MVFKLGNRAVQTSATTGTGTLSLDAPATGVKSFVSEIGSGNTTAFLTVDGSGNWEINIGTVTSGSPDTISRTNPPIQSSNSDNLVNFPAGSKTVACVPIAQLIPYLAAVPSYSNGQILQRVSGNWVPTSPTAIIKTLMGAFTFKSIALSGGVVDLAGADDWGVLATGAGTISSLGTPTNTLRLVKFSASQTVQHNANIVLRTGVDRGMSAGDIMLLYADGSSVWRELAYWGSNPDSTNKHTVSQSFHYPGLVEAISGTSNKMLRHYVSVPDSTYKVSLYGCRYSIEDGTSVPFEVRRNGSGVSGLTGLSATTTPQTTIGTGGGVALADNDIVEVVQGTPVGNPHNFVCTVFFIYARNF